MTNTRSNSKRKREKSTPPPKIKKTVGDKIIKFKQSTSRSKKRGKHAEATTSTFGNNQYRSSLQKMFSAFKTNTFIEEHKALMAKTPFQKMFLALQENQIDDSKKVDKSLDALIRRYNKDNDVFEFGNATGKIRKSDVKLIFGIEDGQQKIDFTRRQTSTSDFTKRLFPGIQKISGKMVLNKLSEVSPLQDDTSIQDTVRLLCMLLVGNCFVSTTGYNITPGYFSYIEDIENMRLYDWSDEIVSVLKTSLRSKSVKETPRGVTGCTLLILYWFFEHYKSMKPNNQTIPRCAGWHLRNHSSQINTALLNNMKTNEFTTEELEPTAEELAYLSEFHEVERNNLIEEKEQEDQQATLLFDRWSRKIAEAEEQPQIAVEEEKNEQQHHFVVQEKKEYSEKMREKNLRLEKEVEELNRKLKEMEAEMTLKKNVEKPDANEESEDADADDYVCQPRTNDDTQLQWKIEQLQAEHKDLLEKHNRLIESESMLQQYAENATGHITKQEQELDELKAEHASARQAISTLTEQNRASYQANVKKREQIKELVRQLKDSDELVQKLQRQNKELTER